MQNKMAPGIADNLGVPDSAQELLFNNCLMGTYSVPDTGQGAWNGEQIKQLCPHGPFVDSRKTEEKAAPLTCIEWTGPLDLKTERKKELEVALS